MARKKKSFGDDPSFIPGDPPDDQLTNEEWMAKYHPELLEGAKGQSDLPWDSAVTSKFASSGNYAPVTKCLDTHPPIKLGESTIYGGSCSMPRVKDADIYVGLDYGTKPQAGWPWMDKAREFRTIDVFYEIMDMHPPKDAESFKAMIEWLCNQLQNRPIKLHVGCIGGHGRTGMVLTAILATFWDRKMHFMLGLPDQELLSTRQFVQWVREHYCKKAVETSGQIAFLMDHFSIAKADPSKTPAISTKGHGHATKGKPHMDLTPARKNRYAGASDRSASEVVVTSPYLGSSITRNVKPVTSQKNVWIVKKV